jgi:nucleotide-binding universal stress UspA family protein
MYQHIVVGTDGSETAEIAVDTAIELARLTGATLHVVNAHKLTSAFQMAAGSEVGMLTADIEAANRVIHDEGTRVCDDAVQRAQGAGVRAETHSVAGEPADALIRVAEATDADLIVVGNRGMKGKRRVLGSVPNTVSHHCATNVLIVDTHRGKG